MVSELENVRESGFLLREAVLQSPGPAGFQLSQLISGCPSGGAVVVVVAISALELLREKILRSLATRDMKKTSKTKAREKVERD
jgi:hypothetical protein